MKKMLLAALVLLVSLFTMACASTEPVAQETPAPAMTTQDDVNVAFERVYNAYREALILDGAQTYTVVSGDFLAAITRRFYSGEHGYFFPLIMLASSDVVLDPELIEPGMVLTIPDLQKNLDDPSARGYLKGFLRDVADVYDQKAASMSDATKETTRGRTRYTEDIRTRDRLITLSESL
jgi:hypothetical protein